MRELNVGIVGGGIAGLASAAFLARDGHRVEVFERAAAIHPAGTGILLQPAGLDVLRRLGVFDAARSIGSPIENVVARRGPATVMNLRYADLRAGLHGLGIRRPALATVLLDAARTSGATVHFSRALASVEALPHDIVLLCDGAGSRLREAAVGRANVRAHATGVFTLIAPAPRGFDPRALMQRVGAGDAAGMLPVGNDGAIPLVSFFWNARVDAVPALRERGYDAWRSQLQRMCPEAGEMLGAKRGFDDLTWYSTVEVSMRRWHRGRVAVLGDAAHALDPHLGVGASMALLDAEGLSQALREAQDVTAALAAWESRRRAHVAPYARVSRLWSRLDRWRLAGLRRLSFRAMARNAATRRRLLRYMSGY
jgi:2-polyprenyl-6-methoxyphenol hydroxylase-like FAD-dependent oxidoreductase